MEHEAMDRILSAEEELAPSSGFLASVMERVEEEAAVPPPIPFPWRRAIPGIVLAGGVLGWGGYELVRLGIEEAHTVTLSAPQIPAGAIRPLETAAWVAGSLAASLLSWVLSQRLAGRSGLL